MALVLLIAIPAFAQNNGPIRIKPLMAYTQDDLGVTTPWFTVGEEINFVMAHEVKGTGSYRYRIEVLDNAGVLIYKIKSGAIDIDTATFQTENIIYELNEVPWGAGYFTLKAFYVDVKTGNTWSHQTKIHVQDPPELEIGELLSQVNESKILVTASDLQGFGTREVGSQANDDAATYLYDRFAAIPRLTVAYQGGALQNVVATLAGTDEASDKVYIVGAHYDSAPGSPGATDNACGVGIVFELARIMSKYRFKHDLKFVAWNAEESGSGGSYAYVNEAQSNYENIELYVNFDSAGYDPNGRLVLDIMFNALSSGVADRMSQLNNSYGLGFTITNNVHSCWSDHKPFWEHGIRSVMTHSEEHGPAHTANDTVDKISTLYAKKNGQLGMAVLAELAALEGRVSSVGENLLQRFGQEPRNEKSIKEIADTLARPRTALSP